MYTSTNLIRSSKLSILKELKLVTIEYFSLITFFFDIFFNNLNLVVCN